MVERLYVMRLSYLVRAKSMVASNWRSFIGSRQSFADRELEYMVAQLARVPKLRMKTTVDLILHHLVANFDGAHLILDCFNPLNALRGSIWALEA